MLYEWQIIIGTFKMAPTYSLKISTPVSVISTGTRTEAGSRDIFTLFDIFRAGGNGYEREQSWLLAGSRTYRSRALQIKKGIPAKTLIFF
jgi:hypothetical protein